MSAQARSEVRGQVFEKAGVRNVGKKLSTMDKKSGGVVSLGQVSSQRRGKIAYSRSQAAQRERKAEQYAALAQASLPPWEGGSEEHWAMQGFYDSEGAGDPGRALGRGRGSGRKSAAGRRAAVRAGSGEEYQAFAGWRGAGLGADKPFESGDKRAVEESAALNAALRLLARREYSRRELQTKLWGKKFSKAVVEAVLDRCVQEGWQSEERTASMLVRHVFSQAYGPKRLAYELRKRGIKVDLESLEDYPPDWLSGAVRALQKKLGERSELEEVADDGEENAQPRAVLTEDEQMKALAFLARRGFMPTMCWEALRIYLKGGEEE